MLYKGIIRLFKLFSNDQLSPYELTELCTNMSVELYHLGQVGAHARQF